MHRLLKVFVVEDDPVLCPLYAEMLRNDPGIATAEAHDLPEAIDLCRRERQVVLLVDLGLPSAKDMEAVTELRKEAPGATLVVITGNVDAEKPARKAGAHGVIIKGSPESIGDGLIKTIRDAVVRHDVELLLAPAVAVQEKISERISTLEDSVRPKPKDAPGK